MKTKQRLISLLLCIAMLFSLCPPTVFAEAAPWDSDDFAAAWEGLSEAVTTPSNIVLLADMDTGTDTLKREIMPQTAELLSPTTVSTEKGTHYIPSDYIYFGINGGKPIKWRVLDAKGGNGTTSNAMFLLAENLLDGVRIQFNNTADNAWQGSTAQKWCTDFASNASNFSAEEQAAMLAATKTEGDSTLYGDYKWLGSPLNKEKVFFLSAPELAQYIGSYNMAPGLAAGNGSWWLRSPLINEYGADSNKHAGAVEDQGFVTIGNVVSTLSVRPAFNLNPDKILFTAEIGEDSIPTGDRPLNRLDIVNTTIGSEWRLTLEDSSRNNFTASLQDNTITYGNAKTGGREYISVLIADSNGAYTHWGSFSEISANGTITVDLSKFPFTSPSTMYVFNERVNGGTGTNYANKPTNANTIAIPQNAYNVTFDVGYLDSHGEKYYFISEENYTATLASDSFNVLPDTITVKVGGKELSAEAGGYTYDKRTGEVKIPQKSINGDIKIIAAGVPKTYALTVTPQSHPFEERHVGYQEAPAAQTFTITNTGNTTTNVWIDSLGEQFKVTKPSLSQLEPNQTATFTVQPKIGLSVGNHTETRNITGSNSSKASVSLSFTVTDHEWSNAWTQDSTHHWHECTIEGCDQKNSYAPHSYTDGVCICSKPHTHQWAEEWSSNDTHHWHECTAEGCNLTANSGKNGYAEHAYSDGFCACGKKEPHAHKWADDWSRNDTHHWRECTVTEDCDITDNSQKGDYGEHAYVGGVCVCGKKEVKAILPGASMIQGKQADNIYFGTYYQSDASEQKKDPIKWRVLANDGGRLFLLADQNLDARKYHDSKIDITWENCTLRTWLNDDFYHAAFSQQEQEPIALTQNENEDNPQHNTPGGNDTKDKVFLLSLAEATNSNYGFHSDLNAQDKARIATNTAYTAPKTGFSADAPFLWRLRTPGKGGGFAAYVFTLGNISTDGNSVHLDRTAAVRPAFNLNQDAVLFTSAALDSKPEGGVREIDSYWGNDWKLTVKDDSHSNFVAECRANIGTKAIIAYKNAVVGANEYISVIIEDNGFYSHYGRLKNLTGDNDASGTAELDLTGIDLTGKKLYVFNEQYNGDKMTDYASELQPITIPPAKNACTVTYKDMLGLSTDGQGYCLINDTYTATLTAESGYALPDAITVTMGGKTLTAGTGYTYHSNSGELSIAKVTGDIEITAGGAPVKTNAATPNITGQPQGANYTAGTGAISLHVAASVSDKGTLSYQWYSNTTNSNTGGSAVSGATKASYTPPTAAEGTMYYYCVITNTNTNATGAKTATAVSDTAEIIVKAAIMPPHTHSWNTAAWTQDGTHHWHECTAADCDITDNSQKNGYGAHIYDNDADETCNTCNYKRTITPSTHTHSWNTAAWTQDGTHHWHECTAADCDITDDSQKNGYGTHIYDNDADETCNTCNYKRTITPPSATEYTVTVQTDGSGTAFASPASATAGTAITLTATADAGFHFKAWQVISGDVTITNNSFIMSAENVIVKAVFEKGTVQSKIETSAITEVPEGLKDTAFNTVEKIKNELTRVLMTQAGYTTANTTLYDVRLQISTDGGHTWIDATEENFPAEGITVMLPYPSGTGKATHNFVVTHMFTVTSLRLGTTAGETEQPAARKTDTGLEVTLKGLSPVGIAWKAIDSDTSGTGDNSGSVSGGDIAPTYYTLTFETNGGSSIDTVKKVSGTRIDLSGYQPIRKDYDFNGWYTDKALTEKITTVQLNSNKTIYAGWTPQAAPSEPEKENPFTDVRESDWFYADVLFVYDEGIMTGTGKSTFSPYQTATRGMMATIIWRMEGSPKTASSSELKDVAQDSYYTEAVQWAMTQGIMNGYGDGVFRPDEPITREQLAGIFNNYAKYKGYDLTLADSLADFADKDSISDWARNAMQWAVGSGLISGKGNGILDPQGTATRAEIAAMLHRFL